MKEYDYKLIWLFSDKESIQKYTNTQFITIAKV